VRNICSRMRISQAKRFLQPISVVFISSIGATILFWTLLPSTLAINESSDYVDFYEPTARNIIGGHGFTIEGIPALRYPPGYPLLLAAIFTLSTFFNISEEAALSAFTLLSMGLTSIFVFLLAHSVWGVRSALLSSLIWMTYPFALWLTKQPTSEMPFLVVFYGGFCLFWYALGGGGSRSWPLFLLVGLLAGFAMLIRPIAIGIGLIMGVILWVVGREMRARLRLLLLAMILLGNLAAILPWVGWVYSTTGKIVMLSSGGLPTILAGLTFAVPQTKGYRQTVKAPQDVVRLMQDIDARSSERRSLAGVVMVMLDALRAQPLTVAKLLGLKVVWSWYATDSGRFETQIMLIQAVYLGLVLWGSGYAWAQGGIAKQVTISIWLMVLYFWGMTVLAISLLRYMVPAIGLLFVLLPTILCSLAGRENKAGQE
jgi:4-amino-4-deoxy-L-arabinose transferase-like glycosyltransferase